MKTIKDLFELVGKATEENGEYNHWFFQLGRDHVFNKGVLGTGCRSFVFARIDSKVGEKTFMDATGSIDNHRSITGNGL